MPPATRVALLVVLLCAVGAHDARADKKTVCTITVNSPDEKERFRRSLPEDGYQFVELVERGRPDWLASACHKGVRCDVLLISGHFDDGTEFYSDRLGARESLPTDELERASCSNSCPGLFSQLKEVYLFGCNTLEAQPLTIPSGEIGRSLVRAGYSRVDAERRAHELRELTGDSNRDRMRHIFRDVPIIYGFSSKAPLGPVAASLLSRYFQSGASTEIGGGRASPKLLSLFAPSSMTVATGLRDSDADAGFRKDICHFSDDRLSVAEKLAFVHALLGREMAEVRLLLDRIERHMASLSEADRQNPAVTQTLREIARDQDARARFLEFAGDADQPAIRARMIELAASLGWLSPAEKRAQLVRMIGDQLGRNAVGPAEVDLVCRLNKNHELDQGLQRLPLPPAHANSVAQAAILACLGSAQAHAQVLGALASPSDEEVELAQVYLQHRPIADSTELRRVATSIVGMGGSAAQVRALDTLASYQLSDRETLGALAQLFSLAKSLNVQRAIAGVLIRSDYPTIAGPELVRVLREHRLRSPDGGDLIDVLIRRVEASYQTRSKPSS
jgi:hypothetical protein